MINIFKDCRAIELRRASPNPLGLGVGLSKPGALELDGNHTINIPSNVAISGYIFVKHCLSVLAQPK